MAHAEKPCISYGQMTVKRHCARGRQLAGSEGASRMSQLPNFYFNQEVACSAPGAGWRWISRVRQWSSAFECARCVSADGRGNLRPIVGKTMIAIFYVANICFV